MLYHNSTGNYASQKSFLKSFYKDTDDSIVRHRSNYNSIKDRNTTLDNICDYISNFSYNMLPKPGPNLEPIKKEWDIIHKLLNNHDVLIKEADTASTVVIVDT